MWMNDIEKALDSQATHIVNDSKTPSGQVHVGSLRGVLIHDAVTRHLKHSGFKIKFTYGIDDYDPMDGLPHDAPATLKKHMGEPLCNIPAPLASTATDFADHCISEFLGIFKELGVDADIYRMRDVYRSGTFDDAIRIILENADTIREIYKTVSGSERPDDWYPFQVICENCGKIGATEVFDYKHGEVSYRCRKDLVGWAEGCSHEGKISPFKGHGKLPWKLEWAAKWFVFGITLEGAGKDHCTKGGSRDIACQVLKRVFKKTPPLNIPYEFFLVKGAKMSSSKGVGASARAMADFLPAEVLRYLMVKSLPRRSVNFSTDLNPVLKIFNEYDSLIEAKQSKALNHEQKQLLHVVEVSGEPENFTPVSFQLLISMLQLPHIDIHDEISRRAGRPLSESDILHLKRRISAAQYWLENYASEDDKYQLQKEIPDSWVDLCGAQKLFLLRMRESLAGVAWDEEHLQAYIFEVARCTPVPAKSAFSSIYNDFLNKHCGPKAGALISFLDREFVSTRLSGVNICDWFACYDELGEDINVFMRLIGEIKSSVGQVTLSPELYLCVKSDEALQDPQAPGFGAGIIRVYYTHKGRSFARLIKSEFAAYGEIARQKRGLIDNMRMLARQLENESGINVSLDEDIVLRTECSTEKVEQYLMKL